MQCRKLLSALLGGLFLVTVSAGVLCTKEKVAAKAPNEEVADELAKLRKELNALKTNSRQQDERVKTLEGGFAVVSATPVWEVQRVDLPGSAHFPAERDVDFGKPVLEAYAVPVSQHWAYDGRGPLPAGGRALHEIFCSLAPRILPENRHVVRTAVRFHMTDALNGSAGGGVSFVVFARTR